MKAWGRGGEGRRSYLLKKPSGKPGYVLVVGLLPCGEAIVLSRRLAKEILRTEDTFCVYREL